MKAGSEQRSPKYQRRRVRGDVEGHLAIIPFASPACRWHASLTVTHRRDAWLQLDIISLIYYIRGDKLRCAIDVTLEMFRARSCPDPCNSAERLSRAGKTDVLKTA